MQLRTIFFWVAVLVAWGCGEDAGNRRSIPSSGDSVDDPNHLLEDSARDGAADRLAKAAVAGVGNFGGPGSKNRPILGLGYDGQTRRYPVTSGSTPDGKLVFASGSNDGSILFTPVRQPAAGVPLSGGSLNSWIAAAGRFELRYEGPAALSPSGQEFTVGSSNQAAVGFDPRFGLAPIRVRAQSDCLVERGAAFYRQRSGAGNILCYKMIVYSAATRSRTGAKADRMLFANRISLALQALDAAGAPLPNPRILGAVFHDRYRPTLSRQPGGKTNTHHGLEVSVTADSRFLLWNAPVLKGGGHIAVFTYSPTPWKPQSFLPPVRLRELHKEFGDKAVCMDADMPKNCPRVRLGDVYKLARKPLIEPFLGRPLYAGSGLPGSAVNDTFRCAYAWITPDGDNLFCSVNGLHQYVIGEDTKHMLYPIDGAMNGFHLRKKGFNNSEADEDAFLYNGRTITPANTFGGFPTVLEKRIEMPVFLGQDSGLWRAFGDLKAPEPIGENRRTRTFHMLLRHGKFEVFDPIRKLVLAADRPATERFVSTFVYEPVSLDSFVDSDFVFFHHFQSVRPEIKREKFTKEYAGSIKDLLVDASGNRNSVRLINARPENELFGDAERHADRFEYYYTLGGYRGQGLHFDLPGGVAHVLNGSGSDLGIANGLTLEFAFKLKPGTVASQSLPLVRIAGGLEVALIGRRIQVQDKRGATELVSISLPGSVNTNLWYHVGVTVKADGTQRTYGVYLNGEKAVEKIIASPATIAVGANAGLLATLGPDGDCDGCRGELVLDEVALAKTARGSDYFRVATVAPMDSAASTATYPFALPDSIKRQDLVIPPSLQLGQLSSAQVERLAGLGNLLFRDDILSVDATGKSQGVSCATCHNPAKAFTDGRRLSRGINTLKLNAPTLVNRVLEASQFFDKRSDSLFHQALDPVLNADEMNGHLPTILSQIRANQRYARGFKGVFGQGTAIEGAHIRKALATFMISITSGDAPVDKAAVRGQDYERGKELFFGKARCISCHNGVNFTDGIIRNTGNGRAVKTPTLREIASTGPFFHDGSAQTLEGVVNFYNKPPLGKPGIDADIRPLGLTGQEVQALTSFLKSGFQGRLRFAPALAPE